MLKKNRDDKILVNYKNSFENSFNPLDQESKEQRKSHEMKIMEQYLKTVPNNVMDEEDTSENLTEPDDNDEVNEEDQRLMLDERDTSEDLTDDEEDSKPKIIQELYLKFPEDDGGDTSDNLTADEKDLEPKMPEQSILKFPVDNEENASDIITDIDVDVKAQNSQDSFLETLVDKHKNYQALDEQAYKNKTKEPVSDYDTDEASTDDDSSSDDEDNPVTKEEYVDHKLAPPSPPPRPSSPSCGSCSGCLIEDDCGCCRSCADSPQFGHSGASHTHTLCMCVALL